MMKTSIKISIRNDNCLLWHRWRLIKDTGKTKYFVCKDCSARRVIQTGEGYQPVDIDWLCKESEFERIKNNGKEVGEMKTQTKLLLAALLLNRFEPMAPHHVGAIRERLGDKTDDELWEIIRTGKFE